MSEKRWNPYDLLSVAEAAGALRCSPQTIYRAVHEQRIVWFRVRERGQIKIPYYALEGLIAPELLKAVDTATLATSTQEVRS
jgi:excisionase family DNA binding protein